MDRTTAQLRPKGLGDIKTFLKKTPPAPPVKGTQLTHEEEHSFDHHNRSKPMDRTEKDYRGRRHGSSRSTYRFPPRRRNDHRKASTSTGEQPSKHMN
jgi:hypothetical protein